MYNKILAYAIFLLFFILSPPAFALVTTPSGLSLTPGDQSIEVNWIANSDDTTDYYLYWGTTADIVTPPLLIKGKDTNSFTISGLLPNITYYVAISAYDNIANLESLRSEVLSATTLDSSGLMAPTGLWIDSAFGISTTYAGFKWTASNESNIAFYTLYYGIATGVYSTSLSTADTTTFLNVTGLSSSTRYYCALSVTDLSSAESPKSTEIIVDTLPDSNPPYIPGTPSAAISGNGEIEISFADNNDIMADFSHFVVAYDTVSTVLGFSANAGSSNVFTVGGLTVNTDYYFAVKAVDTRGNESAYSPMGHIYVEEVKAYLDQAGIKEGCFIATALFGDYDHPVVKVLREFRDSYLKSNAAGRRIIHFYYEKGPGAAIYVKNSTLLKVITFILLLPFILFAFLLVKTGPLFTISLLLTPFLWRYRKYGFMLLVMSLILLSQSESTLADEHNTLGIKIGYFDPSDDAQAEYYEPTPLISIFYDLKVASYLSTELSAGYLYRKGDALTISGKNTVIESEMTVKPLSLSLKFHVPITDYIGTYLGAGGDYWYFKEKSAIYDEELEVGGYHGKIGLVLKKMPNLFDDVYTRNFKVTLEAIYSKIDRFGDNETDLGGWTFNGAMSVSF